MRKYTLHVEGYVGSGKLEVLHELSAFAVSHLLLTSTSNTTVGYFFCRYDDSESTTARVIVGSLARQLLCDLPRETFAELDRNLQQSSLDVDEVFEVLKSTLLQSRQYSILIDGLNECEDIEAQQTIEIMERLLNLDELNIKIYCSFRTNSLNWPLSAATWPCYRILINAADIEADINHYIQATLEKNVMDDLLQVGDAYIVLAVREALVEGAKGMFVAATSS